MAGKRQAKTIEFWFRKKYNLPPTDPRFLDATLDEIESDYWAHYYDEHPATEEIEDETFDLQDVLESMQDDNAWDEVINDGTDSDHG